MVWHNCNRVGIIRLERGMAMIEKIANPNTNETEQQKTDTLFRMPRNIRQVGQINDRKIYIEDYVMTYIRRLGSEMDHYNTAVLLGRLVKAEEGKCIFISGAIELEQEKEEETLFTDKVWNTIYEVKKQYFPELEIMGWAVMEPGLILEPSEQMEKIHIDNFAGQDKVLLLYDSIEREESFFLFEGKHLKDQNGYFIYYEKNEVMQSYMLEHKEERANPEIVEDKATKEIRKIFAKKNEKKAKKQRRNTGFIFASGTVAAATILLLGISSNKNNQLFEKMFQNLVQDQEQESIDTQTTSVETITAGEITIKGEKIVGDYGKDQENGKVTDTTQSEEDENQEDKNIDNENESKDLQEKDLENDSSVEEQDSQNTETMKEGVESIEYYIVKKGDTLVSISRDIYQSSAYVEKIKEANGLLDADKIYIGQRLIIPNN